jgi:hypothetical protein
MSSLIKRWIPAILFTVVPGLVVLAGYLLPSNQTLVDLRHNLVEWAVIVAAFAFLLGVFNILRVHGTQVFRQQQGWFYSVVLLFAMVAAATPPTAQAILRVVRPDSPVHKTLEDATSALFIYTISPLGASLAALLVFTLTLGAFRLLRARRSVGSVLFLLVVALVLLGTTPLIGLEWLADVRDWIVNVPGMAGMRGLLLGVALGVIITALRVFLTIDRPYSEF